MGREGFADRLVAGDEGAWRELEDVLADSAAFSEVSAEVARVVVGRLEVGDEIPEAATRFIARLDDEQFMAFGRALFDEAGQNDDVEWALGDWDDLIARVHKLASQANST